MSPTGACLAYIPACVKSNQSQHSDGRVHSLILHVAQDSGSVMSANASGAVVALSSRDTLAGQPTKKHGMSAG